MSRHVSKVYSTGAAAKIFGVSQQTVIRWCEMGRLGHFLVGKHRKIPHDALIAFADRELGRAASNHVRNHLGLELLPEAEPVLG